MDFFKKINARAKTASNTGFGDNASSYGGRFLNKNGEANIHKTGIVFLNVTVGFIACLQCGGLNFLLLSWFFISWSIYFLP